MQVEFRNLYPSEIECKAVVSNSLIEISLHTTAAICTKLLNDVVGVMNWEKEYTNGNKNCIVRIWDAEKQRMISKEDCGGALTEIDGYKGQASNGFKRVCALGWGLGIELYSQPEIKIPMNDENVFYNGKQNNMIVSEHYSVKEIEYDENKNITHCVIIDSKHNVVYDGPNEQGKSNVVYIPPIEEEVIIPEDADEKLAEEFESNNISDNFRDAFNNDSDASIVDPYLDGRFNDELPDNTDGYEEYVDEKELDMDAMNVPEVDAEIDYKVLFEEEIKRTHVKTSDVLKKLEIKSLKDVDKVSKDILEPTLERLKAMPTYHR